MSTRFVKKDNSILVGIAKNGSQAIKQIGLNNDGVELREQQVDWNQDNFIDWNDSNLLILFPIRPGKERAQSELLEHAMDYDVDLTKPYHAKLDYFSNDVMKYFIENILCDENWKGVKVRFFDLAKLSTHVPKYLGWDIEIPYYNTSKGNNKKVAMMKKLKDVEIIVPAINIIFYNTIRKSKYWIDL